MIDKPELDKRKAFILATVVYEYINTAEPVGSGTLAQKYNLGVSSATIRNEMAELEAGGYLVQPHTSAGRVPSDAGYRTYVDRLMTPESLTKDDSRRIRGQFRDASRELTDVIEQTTRLLSGLSGNLAIAIAPSRDTHAFKHVQLLWLSARTSLAVVVTSAGVAAQRVFEWQSDVDADTLTCTHGKDIVFQRKDISTVKLPHPVRSALVGTAIGAGVGAGIGALAGRNGKDVLGSRGGLAILFAIPGAIIGLIIGATKNYSYSTVYEAP